MFKSCKNLKSINFGKLNMSLVTNMNRLFENCSLLSSIDLSYFETSNVDFYNNIFNGIYSDDGIIKYNSSIFNIKILNDLPNTWKRIDIN